MSYRKISAPIRPDFPDEWYTLATADHFWLTWRLRVFLNLMKDLSIPTHEHQRVLEIGCGAGVVRTQMENSTRWTVDAADVNEVALSQAIPARGDTLLYDIHDRNPEFKGVYDGLVLFDVLEHISDEGRFLASAAWHLKPGGWVAINVPALPGLYSNYDKAAGHFRRYTSASLRDRLQKDAPEIVIQHSRYWGLTLLPIAWLRKPLMNRVPMHRVIQTGFEPPIKMFHTLLKVLMRVETVVIRRPPLGTSLIALAIKH